MSAPIGQDQSGTERFENERDLGFSRVLNAPAAVLFSCWTTPEHLKAWFVPKPNRVTHCDLDPRAGGKCNTTFDVGGTVMENNGVYLEVVQDKKIVFTDAYTEGWLPNPTPFMTAIVTFEDLGDGTTRYSATARHLTGEAKVQHRDMGFFDGWGAVADQLEDYAQSLSR
ncbi:hypothetical protein AQS8620_00987 [Aquimixticola soesokkakensis]|uniref:Activator of Hsp90 ATPase homologue 1/2-like C-terminal domain-containing protein n=1 Tax=Aquimixticola soesokkakensis TaxID=1519096 RepID=A0A1Y5S3S9_9RHOB|nr:SRPBCC family protein [Aquimixticola soesokkakensis]SLN30994.1 hypothetical protein AQS8620_00987 [Aquimixticola soesokkakensis]